MDVLVLSKEWEAQNLEDELGYCSCFVIASIAHFTQMKRETGGRGDKHWYSHSKSQRNGPSGRSRKIALYLWSSKNLKFWVTLSFHFCLYSTTFILEKFQKVMKGTKKDIKNDLQFQYLFPCFIFRIIIIPSSISPKVNPSPNVLYLCVS